MERRRDGEVKEKAAPTRYCNSGVIVCCLDHKLEQRGKDMEGCEVHGNGW